MRQFYLMSLLIDVLLLFIGSIINVLFFKSIFYAIGIIGLVSDTYKYRKIK